MNEQIKKAREAALGLLQPSKRDLEHGLELHENSLVFESYGFSPAATIDGDKLAAAMEAGASQSECEEMREDMMMTRKATNEADRKEMLEAWDASGVTCIFQNAGAEHDDPLVVMKRLAHYTYVSDLLRDVAPKAVSPDDVELAHKEGRHAFYMSANAVPLPQRWISFDDEMTYIRVFFHLGIRMMHLTYNRRNPIGDGCGEAANGGLSDFGQAVVKRMNEVGVIVDVAHSGHRTSLEAAQVSEKPMVSSHSGAHALSPHYRCKPDEVIKAIADTGGYCGVCCIGRFLGGHGDIVAFLDHIEYMVKRFGSEHVVIGTDVCHVPKRGAAEHRKLPPRPKNRSPWRSLWPESPVVMDDGITNQHQLSLAWTNWPLFTVGMVQRGFSDQDIQNILGGNVMRVAKALWDTREM
jgi:membrane dipeptidase